MSLWTTLGNHLDEVIPMLKVLVDLIQVVEFLSIPLWVRLLILGGVLFFVIYQAKRR